MDSEQIGTNDLRYEEERSGGFVYVHLRDVDDGDHILILGDDIRALRDRLTKTIEGNNL